ncbi:hypothetical protein [Calothrix sp. NIES-2100]
MSTADEILRSLISTIIGNSVCLTTVGIASTHSQASLKMRSLSK